MAALTELDSANAVGTAKKTSNNPNHLKNLKTPWKKGQSGNPTGLPQATRDVVSLARDYTTLAITRLAELAQQNKNPGAAVRACEVLLERGYGRSPANVNVMHMLAGISPEALQEVAARILEKRRALEAKTSDANVTVVDAELKDEQKQEVAIHTTDKVSDGCTVAPLPPSSETPPGVDDKVPSE